MTKSKANATLLNYEVSTAKNGDILITIKSGLTDEIDSSNFIRHAKKKGYVPNMKRVGKGYEKQSFEEAERFRINPRIENGYGYDDEIVVNGHNVKINVDLRVDKPEPVATTEAATTESATDNSDAVQKRTDLINAMISAGFSKADIKKELAKL